MYTHFGPALGITAFGLHIIGVLSVLGGTALLGFWALKALNLKQLKLWGFGLLILGIVLSVVTLGAYPFLHGGGMRMNKEKCMMDDSGQCMMNKDGMMMNHSMPGMDHEKMMMKGMNMDPMSMSMDDMASMLEGKTGDDFDKAFLEGMIPHHQGAIDMAIAARASAEHEEIKAMAEAIIATQQQEIDQMNAWMKEWGYVN